MLILSQLKKEVSVMLFLKYSRSFDNLWPIEEDQ